MGEVLYLDTSAVLRAILEIGTSPLVEDRIRSARALVSSRLSLVESCRALIRLRALDAIHLATYVLARRRLDGLELVTADERLQAAAAGVR